MKTRSHYSADGRPASSIQYPSRPPAASPSTPLEGRVGEGRPLQSDRSMERRHYVSELPSHGTSSCPYPVSSIQYPASNIHHPASIRAFTMVEIAISLAIIGFALAAIVGVL